MTRVWKSEYDSAGNLLRHSKSHDLEDFPLEELIHRVGVERVIIRTSMGTTEYGRSSGTEDRT